MPRLSALLTINELQTMNFTIEKIYKHINNRSRSALSDLSMEFMDALDKQFGFDKCNIMFYKYNNDINAFKVETFFQNGWKDDDIANYAGNYCKIDDTLPLMATNQEIAFINGDIFTSREKTKYFKECVKPMQLCNSLDANILLSSDPSVHIALGLFRNSNNVAYTYKELQIVQLYQPHLSNVYSQIFIPDDNLDNNIDVFYNTLSNFESLGLCVLNYDLELESYNSPFEKIALSDSIYTSILEHPLIGKIKEICTQMKNPLSQSGEKLGPIVLMINDKSFHVEIISSGNDNGSKKFVCILVTDDFSAKMLAFQNAYKLTIREFEILSLILKQGLANEEISSQLFISISTVKKHLTSAYKKIGIKNEKQLNALFRDF